MWRVTVEVPLLLAAGVNVRTPDELTAGRVEKRVWFAIAVTTNETVWDDSSAGPGSMAPTQSLTVCGPAFSDTA